jgi:hypothetical protein
LKAGDVRTDDRAAFIAVLGVLIIATMVGAFLMSRPYWLYVSRSDVGVPRGFYRCQLTNEGSVRVRQCYVGVDGAVLREETHPDGTVHRRWFAHGQMECLRETIGPTGKKLSSGENTCRRISGPARN